MVVNEDLTMMVNSASYRQLKDFYERKSSLDILGISRKEYAHSNFLYWLLNDKSNHKLGTLPLKYLLTSCLKINGIDTNATKSNIFPIELIDYISTYDFDVKDLKILREFDIKEFGRLDLLLDFKMNMHETEKEVVMIIENKIYSDENDNQTDKYYEWLNKKFDMSKIIPICLYLTPFKAVPSNNHFVNMTYEHLVRTVIERCLYTTENEYVRFIISDYLRCLTFNDTKENIAVTSNEMIFLHALYNEYSETIKEMIYTEDIRQNEIYKDNKNIFENILNMLSLNKIGGVDEDMKKKIDDILGNTKEYKFGKETYKSGSRQNSLKKLALAIIKDYAKGKSLEELSNDLKGICTTAKGLQLLVKAEEISKNEDLKGWYFEDESELIKIGDTDYSLYAWWNNEEIQELIKVTDGRLTDKVQ